MAEAGERAIELARRSDRPWDLPSALGISVFAFCALCRFDRARDLADEAEPLALQEGDLGTVVHAKCGRALASLRTELSATITSRM
jgi:hypothetical protein